MDKNAKNTFFQFTLQTKEPHSMKQTKVLKILAVLVVAAIILSVSVTFADNSPTLNAPNDSVKVSPAKLFWEKTYGGASDDRAFNSIPTGNGSFLVIGSSKSMVQDKIVGWAMELDSGGNAVWNQTYLAGNGTELRFAINLADGFLLVGNAFLASGDVNGYAAKVDSAGNLKWNVTVGGEKIDKLFSAAATDDGFVLCGLTYSFGSQNSSAWIVKIDLNGNLVWNKIFSGSTEDALRTCVYCTDGNVLAAGYTKEQLQSSDYDFLLLKINPSGDFLWNKTFGGVGSQKAYSIAKTADGAVIAGDSISQKTNIDAYLVKVNLNGDILWTKTVGGADADSPATIVASKDGGFLVSGFTFSYGKGYRDFWLFKTDASGKGLWSCTLGDSSYQEAYGVIEQGPNKFVMIGWTDPKGQPALVGKATYDFYVAQLGVSDGVYFSSLKIAVWVATVAASTLFVAFAAKTFLTKRK
jgi:hypothetical protein